ncbi:MAG TPA: molecular chaperone HtpG [Burkholderiales bacterium]|nr:molecular chaperone HtpG [Burkholderiales bacterium]
MGFQAEVKQLLRLMAHSLYSNREIFLRELISNAADACDKLRFEGLANGALYEDDPEPKIRIDYDKAARTLTIADNGIGMSREEIVEHLGTIAKSGTREFFAKLSGDQQKDAHLIGQFGVGFYSAFVVADKVTVTSRRAGLKDDQAVRWESDGAGEFTVEPVSRAARGTEITLHLKADQDDLLSGIELRGIVRKYSDHVVQPIVMQQEEWDKDKSEYRRTGEEEKINQASALWMRPKSEITAEQYHEFYKHVAHDFTEPLAWIHSKIEGKNEYTQLLYVPLHAPLDLWDREQKHGVKLYVRRVFIMDDTGQMMPSYLRFIRGVVDSNDLPLNVSRELLQQSKDMEAIRSGCARKVLDMLEKLAKDEPEKYKSFWGGFGRVLKEGVGEDYANRERIVKLLRFASTHADTEEQSVSFADYMARMKPDQKAIYYITADSFKAAKNSPHLEVFRRKNIEVLLLHDRVDEWVLSNLHDVEGKPLESVAKGELDLGKLEDASEKKKNEEVADEFKALVEKFKQHLDGRVKDVRITYRLTDSPACLVSDKYDIGLNMARILKAAGQGTPSGNPILELNPEHPLIRRLKNDDKNVAEWANVLFDQATLTDGGRLDDPGAYVKRINQLMLAFTASGT